MLSRASLYFHTLRHLRPQQVVARVRYRLASPSVPLKATPHPAAGHGRWTLPPERRPSLLGPLRVRFLNRERELTLPGDWQADEDRLWLYNLHYFDDLTAASASARSTWHEQLIAAWIRDNPAAHGVGWEPYPISVRSVNWIKRSLGGQRLDEVALGSLATQLRYLRGRVEWHLLGNHIWANAKALLFGGLFFAGDEADEWLEFGARLFCSQAEEQILADGGHFERSPMYHALALEDALDVMNLMRAYPNRTFPERAHLESLLPETGAKMRAWLDAMTHPDGEIAFFNDAAIGIALQPAALKGYAEQLNIGSAALLADLQLSGYARLEKRPWTIFYDAAPVGPDYQPGHAHADTLAFELSVDDERLISNAGTSTYEPGAQRDYERSTRAHNTVEIDGENSSEVWASFRVARRARPLDRRMEVSDGAVRATCAHDGYRRLSGRPLHRRTIEVTAEAVRWTDRVEGSGSHLATGFIPLHPGVRVDIEGSTAKLRTPRGKSLILAGKGIRIFTLGEGSHAREFGVREARPVIIWELDGAPPFEASFALRLRP